MRSKKFEKNVRSIINNFDNRFFNEYSVDIEKVDEFVEYLEYHKNKMEKDFYESSINHMIWLKESYIKSVENNY